jgi:hypothetical protein
MQRTRSELEAMSHAELVERVLEMQDMLREGLAVRDSLHAVLNRVLAANEEQVVYYADLDDEGLDAGEHERKKAWAAARVAVANPGAASRVRGGDGA